VSDPPSDQVVTYQVTNGVAAVTGQVTVLWAKALPTMPPVSPATYAVVRAGDEVDVPVLSSANDPDGESVFLPPGGDPSSIEFCHQAGLTYVSCSPFRVPVARLAAAQAALSGGERDK